jgi:hypothetical protein
LWIFFQPPPISRDGEHILGIDFAGFAETGNEEEGGLGELGAIYEFSRSPDGWVTEALEPPSSVYAHGHFVAASVDLSRSLWRLTRSAPGEEVFNPEADEFAIRERLGSGQATFRNLGPEVPESAPNQLGYFFKGASQDLSHVLFSITSGTGQLWPGDNTHEGDESLYEYVGVEDHEPRLVGVSNEGPLAGSPYANEHAHLISECGTLLGSAGEVSTYNAVSADGGTVFFTALHNGCATPTVNELYARLDGSKTVAVSEPAMTPQREVECTGACREDEEDPSKRSPAVFQGASEDGSQVYFTTEQPLLNSDTDATNDLYEAEIGEHGVTRLIQVSRGEGPDPGFGADVVGVARISEDGSHVYYVARGILASRSTTGEVPEEGGYNLYMYDASSGHTAFIGALMTGAEAQELEARFMSEEQAECKRFLEEERQERAEECERELAHEVARKVAQAVKERTGYTPEDRSRPFETTADGRFLLFESPRPLTGPEDTSTVQQLFEYDAEANSLVRVSVGEHSITYPNGYNDDGNVTKEEYAPRMLAPRYETLLEPTEASSALSLAEDGRVFFTSKDALTEGAVEGTPTPGDKQGTENIYEFEGDNVQLISPGDEPAPLQTEQSRLLGADLSGSDAFFFSTDALLPQDSDTQANWYDAREDGGFPGPASPTGCSEDACQGPLSTPPILPASGGSAAASPGENLGPRTVSPPLPATHKRRPPTRAEELAAALKACRHKAAKKRRSCEVQARRRYGPKSPAKTVHGTRKDRR